jgi:predicted  nucleic acid-binding Zn-ribbon protein
VPFSRREALVSDDLLETLLRTALAAPTTLDERTLPRFAEALRARAAQILAERVQPLEERAAAFEKENAWRAGIIAALEKEKEHWTAEREALIAEATRLKAELGALGDEKRAASEAHDRLLAHHRATLQRLAERIEAIPAGLPWSYRRARRQIAELLEMLRGDAP